jgi:hypothetical protein
MHGHEANIISEEVLPMSNLNVSFVSRRRFSGLVSALVFGTLATVANAGATTPGNLVVLRVNSTAALSSAAATACFFDEYTTSGTLVQSIPLPITGTNSFITSGSSGNDGQLSRSQDRQYIMTAGYTSAPGTTGVAAVAATTAQRVVARLDKLGNVDTSTLLGTTAFSGLSVRWAASVDGSAFWVGGSATGVEYATLGGGTLATLTNSSALVNTRSGQVVGNTLYMGHGSGATTRIDAWPGNPPPTSGTGLVLNQQTGLPTSGTGMTGFALVSVNPTPTIKDTLYLTDNSTIDKYVWNGSAWVAMGTVGTIGAAEAYGITAIKVPGSQTVDIYFTAGSTAGNTIQHIQDASGYNQTMTGTAAVIVTATNDVPNTNINAFRGLVETADTATLVDMLTFGATANGTDITVTWTSQSEKNAVGFNIWRATSLNGQYVKVNPNLIPAVGSIYAGASYSYHDLVTAGQTFFYRLEDIDLAGVATYQPAVEVTASSNRTPPPAPPRPTPAPPRPVTVSRSAYSAM